MYLGRLESGIMLIVHTDARVIVIQGPGSVHIC